MADQTLRSRSCGCCTRPSARRRTSTTIMGLASFDGVLSAASFVPNAAITGNDTNKFTLTIVNKGQAGSGTTVMATLDFANASNGVAYDEKAFTLSATAANLVVASGDVIACVSTHTGGTGLANPGGHVVATFVASVA
jgi:hypothetical protein